MAGVLGDALADRGGKVKVIKGGSARRVPLGQCGDRGGRFRCGAKGIRTPDLLVAKVAPGRRVPYAQCPSRCIRCMLIMKLRFGGEQGANAR
jgi:hypothetical protein